MVSAAAFPSSRREHKKEDENGTKWKKWKRRRRKRKKNGKPKKEKEEGGGGGEEKEEEEATKGRVWSLPLVVSSPLFFALLVVLFFMTRAVAHLLPISFPTSRQGRRCGHPPRLPLHLFPTFVLETRLWLLFRRISTKTLEGEEGGKSTGTAFEPQGVFLSPKRSEWNRPLGVVEVETSKAKGWKGGSEQVYR